MSEPAIVLRDDVETFVNSVGGHLRDLPHDDRVDLLDELREHATLLCRESPDMNLVGRLGDPAAYALELREAARLPAIEPSTRRALRSRIATVKSQRWWLVATRFIRDMTPLWWSLRGVAAAMLLRYSVFNGMRFLHFVVMAALAGFGGWWIGPRAQRWSAGTNWRAAARIVIDVAVACVLVAGVLEIGNLGALTYADSAAAEPAAGFSNNGNTVTSIRAFGQDGKPISVALYDQDGVPLDIAWPYDQVSCPDDASALPIPHRDSSGTIITNIYPVRAVCIDSTNIVVAPAVTGPIPTPSAAWVSDPLPSVGEHVSIDSDGNFSGALIPAPTPSGVPSANPGVVLPSPSPTPVR